MQNEQHLTQKEVATRLKISPRWVEKLRANGGGPAFMELGDSPKLKTIRYKLSDVIAYEESRKRGGVAIEPDGWRKAMTRAAACLDAVAGWDHTKPAARATVSGISDELRALLGAGK